jgi:hypothetical protein
LKGKSLDFGLLNAAAQLYCPLQLGQSIVHAGSAVVLGAS